MRSSLETVRFDFSSTIKHTKMTNFFRTKNVEKSAAYSKTFKGNDDGKVNSSGPRQIVAQNGMGPGSGYIQR